MQNKMKRFFKNWQNIIKDFFVGIGFLWLITEVSSFFFEDFINSIKTNYGVCLFGSFLLISLFFSVIKNLPKSSFKIKIRNKDSWIKLKIGDAFKNEGSLIIPINNDLDSYLNGNLAKAKSLHNKLINDYFDNDYKKLDELINTKIIGKVKPFEIGSVIEIEKNLKRFFKVENKRFYLLVNTKKQENHRVNSTIDDFMISINRLWDFLSSDTIKGESITIPLINTQHGRNVELTREVVIKQIIDTFIDSSKYSSICEELIITIHPSDIEKGNLDFDKLCEYLSFQAQNYKVIKFDTKTIGQEIESSVVTGIES